MKIWLAGLLFSAIVAPNSLFAEESVCAVVKLEIQQELTLERQAFDAVMKITNGLDSLPITDVNINVTFADADGVAVQATTDPNDTTGAKFFIRQEPLVNITDVSGTGVVEPLTTAEARWLIIPAAGAANAVPTGSLYFVGATVTYNLGGEPQTLTKKGSDLIL